MQNKKAAMFGLDARIALAIFGALSVISGAALYSAIQESKAISLLADMTEMSKAYEAYYLDTGDHLTLAGTAAPGLYLKKGADLVNKPAGVSNWNGPYLQYDFSGFYLLYPNYNNIHYAILSKDDASWGETKEWTDGYCTSGKKCGLYVMLNGITSLDILKAIDVNVDGSVDSTSGEFKYTSYTLPANSYAAMLYIMPSINPND